MGKKTETMITATEAKPARKAKAEPKARKPANVKRERPPKEDLVVFALRMTEAERTKLHDTAGPRGATRLARAVLIAAAREDESAFRTAIKEVREARA